jgi:hypothetical protein
VCSGRPHAISDLALPDTGLDFGGLRCFSVVPSWGARIEQAWWEYHPERMREEVALAKQVHANRIRL